MSSIVALAVVLVAPTAVSAKSGNPGGKGVKQGGQTVGKAIKNVAKPPAKKYICTCKAVPQTKKPKPVAKPAPKPYVAPAPAPKKYTAPAPKPQVKKPAPKPKKVEKPKHEHKKVVKKKVVKNIKKIKNVNGNIVVVPVTNEIDVGVEQSQSQLLVNESQGGGGSSEQSQGQTQGQTQGFVAGVQTGSVSGGQKGDVEMLPETGPGAVPMAAMIAVLSALFYGGRRFYARLSS